MKLALVTLLMLSMLSQVGKAESISPDNGLANSLTGSLLVNPDGAAWSPNTTLNNGRDTKAQDAQGRGDTGTGAAIAAGSALLATGIPMLASIIPEVAAAGAVLVAEAGLEFAQAGANNAATNQNTGQKDLLRLGLGPNAENPLNINPPIPPELNQLAANNGFNAQDLMNQVTSGNLRTPSDVLNAVGNTYPFSQDELKAASGIAANATADMGLDRTPLLGMRDLGANPEASSPPADGSSSGASSPTSPTGGVLAKGTSGSGADGGSVSAVESRAIASQGSSGAVVGSVGKGSASIKRESGQETNTAALLDQLVAQGSDKAGAVAKETAALEKLGIYRQIRGTHIFFQAHRNFDLFGQWRNQSASNAATRRSKVTSP